MKSKLGIMTGRDSICHRKGKVEYVSVWYLIMKSVAQVTEFGMGLSFSC